MLIRLARSTTESVACLSGSSQTPSEHDYAVTSMSWKLPLSRRASRGKRSRTISDEGAAVGIHYVWYCWVGIAAAALIVGATYQLAFFSALAFLCGVVALVCIDLRAVLTLTFPIYALTGAVASVAFIESGTYITEQYRFGFNIGATGALGLFSLGFLGVAHVAILWAGTRTVQKFPASSGRTISIIVFTIGVGSAVAYGLIFLIWGTALAFNTRFEWSSQLPSVVATAHTMLRSYLIPVGFCLAGFLLPMRGLKGSWSTLTLALPMVALIGAGDKFSGFLLQFTMYLLGLGVSALMTGQRLRVRPVHLLIAASVVGLLTLALAVGYTRSGSASAVEAITQRFALQGHVWFGIFDRFEGKPGGVGLMEMVKNNSHDSPSGLDALSYLVSRHDFVYERIGRGVSFTMGGPVTVLAVFGAIGGLGIYSVMGLLYVFVVVGIIRLRGRHWYLTTMVLMALYIIVGYGTLMGYWDALYGPVALACYAVLAVFLLWSSRGRWRALWVRGSRRTQDLSV